MENKSKSINIHFHSSHYKNVGEDHSHFVIQLSNPLHNVKAIQLLDIVFLNSLPNILSDKTLRIIENVTTYNITIPAGNYVSGSDTNVGTLQNTIKTLMEAKSAKTYEVDEDEVSGKLTIKTSDNTALTIDVSESTIAPILGFTSDQTGTTLISNLPLDLTGTKSLYVLAKNIGIHSMLKDMNAPILQKIELLNGHMGVNILLGKWYVSTRQIDVPVLRNIELQIVDHNLQPIQIFSPWEGVLVAKYEK